MQNMRFFCCSVYIPILLTPEIVKIRIIYNPPAGHVITGNLNVIPDSRIRYIISKGPKYRFPFNIDFPKWMGHSNKVL